MAVRQAVEKPGRPGSAAMAVRQSRRWPFRRAARLCVRYAESEGSAPQTGSSTAPAIARRARSVC